MSKEELEDNIDEMMRLLHDRFVAGLDKHFDYTEIDHNTNYDDIKTLDQDKADEYFDDEEPETKEGQLSEYTGEIDY